MHHPDLEKEIAQIIASPEYDPKVQQEFAALLNEGKFLREEGAREHFSLYFLPYNKKEGKVFLVHHKKADQWLAPGGHIDSNETLLQTLNREIEEELRVVNQFSSLPKPFHLSIVELENPRPDCLRHYDIWYLFETDGANFQVNPAEFRETRWFTVEEARKILRDKTNLEALNKLNAPS
ncbi:MAG TPA: NUDIX domain-containing protein [Candidatus Paceibacterota bacterium]|nr:NUDIX domain-containing protein [Candidatus Paceibacterota bacterium]